MMIRRANGGRGALVPAILTACLLAGPADCRAQSETPSLVALPAPRRTGDSSLEQAIDRRSSVRAFRDEDLSLEEVSQLLWAAGGRTSGRGGPDGVSGATRSFPSAGGIYPQELFLVAGRVRGVAQGVYRYSWSEHALRPLKRGDHRTALARAALSQAFVGEAPAVVVIAADPAKTAARYGSRGVQRYLGMDVGHAAQNLCLQAEALGLGTVPVGAFNDRAVKAALGLGREEPFLLLPVGRPR